MSTKYIHSEPQHNHRLITQHPFLTMLMLLCEVHNYFRLIHCIEFYLISWIITQLHWCHLGWRFRARCWPDCRLGPHLRLWRWVPQKHHLRITYLDCRGAWSFGRCCIFLSIFWVLIVCRLLKIGIGKGFVLGGLLAFFCYFLSSYLYDE